MQTAEVIDMEQQGETFAISKLGLTPERVAAMVDDYKDMAVIEGDTASYKVCRKALTLFVSTRTNVDKRRKELGAKARKWISDVNSAAKSLLEPLSPVEASLRESIKAEDDRKEAIKAEAIRVEQERVDGIQAKINSIRQMVTSLAGIDSDGISAVIGELDLIELPVEEYQEFVAEANQAKADARVAAMTALEAAQKLEAEDAARKAESERLEKIRKEQEAEAARLKAEQDRIDAERRAEQEKLDAERRELEAEKARIATEEAARKTKIAAEEKAKADADLLKKEIAIAWDEAHIMDAEWEKEAKAKAEAEAARTEAIKPDKAKLAEFAIMLKTIPVPALNTEEARGIIHNAVADLNRVAADLEEQIEAM